MGLCNQLFLLHPGVATGNRVHGGRATMYCNVTDICTAMCIVVYSWRHDLKVARDPTTSQ